MKITLYISARVDSDGEFNCASYSTGKEIVINCIEDITDAMRFLSSVIWREIVKRLK